jgi:hypothetical protein
VNATTFAIAGFEEADNAFTKVMRIPAETGRAPGAVRQKPAHRGFIAYSLSVFPDPSIYFPVRLLGLPFAGQGGSCMRVIVSLAVILLTSGFAAAESPQSIEKLLSEGWEIAGYASGYDNRTSLILFRHAGTNALVQCGVLFDVTRNPHTIVNCYELH